MPFRALFAHTGPGYILHEYSTALDPSGTRLLDPPRRLCELPAGVGSAGEFSPNGQYLAAAHNGLAVWDVSVPEQPVLEEQLTFSSPYAIAWSLESNLLAAGNQSNTLALFRRQPEPSENKWRETASISAQSGVLDLAFNDAATVLVAGTLSSGILVYRISAAESEKPVLVHTISIAGARMTSGVSFHPMHTNVFAAGDGNGAVNICDADTGSVLRTLKVHTSRLIRRIKFDLQGERILTACYDSNAAVPVSWCWLILSRSGGAAGQL
eukprot:TRINITY_DN2523_c0_g1_i5.p1 TRINITY_DN2523_c0_g1~~TRINITY_DN2523_c0_g1_i5.p1  ORF type:complete len:268 (-),score=61.50 TRINITY_DN2523_c0_g1_i5:470-1273(-)